MTETITDTFKPVRHDLRALLKPLSPRDQDIATEGYIFGQIGDGRICRVPDARQIQNVFWVWEREGEVVRAYFAEVSFFLVEYLPDMLSDWALERAQEAARKSYRESE